MAMEIPILRTKRLVLRPLELHDAAAVQRLFPQWEIVRYLAASVPWPYPADGALTFIRDAALPGMLEGREWHWSIRLATVPAELIGIISLRDETDNNRGFWLSPEWHGQGLMTEASAAVTAYWFEVLGKPVLRAPKAAPNEPSRRISQRQAMRLVRIDDRDYVSGRFSEEIWEITAEEWRRLNYRQANE
jgi:ribosomal-protein-alanine N-acetyltransferase